MAEQVVRWEDMRELQQVYRERNVYKDKELALLLANGEGLNEAAMALGMTIGLASAIANTPTFKLLVEKLRREREQAVYSDDPDEMTESLARGNVWTLKQIRDNPGGRDTERLKAALALHEMRPSVRKSKMEEQQVRVIFDVAIVERLQEGMKKLEEPAKTIEVEGEFSEIEKGE